MKTKSIIFFGLLLAVMAGFLTELGVSSPPMGGYRLGLSVDGKAVTKGPTRLRFRVIDVRRPKYDSMLVKVTSIGNLKYLGDPMWTFRPKDSLSLTYFLEVLIPKGDTCGIAVDLWFDNVRHFDGTQIYFVTTGDTVESYGIRPVPPEPPQPDIGTPDYLKPDFGKPLVYTKDRGKIDAVTGTIVFPKSIDGFYRLGLGVDGKATTDSPSRLRLRILDADRTFDSVIIKISTIGNVKYLGDPVWVYKPSDSLDLTYYLNVLIPKGDTSGIAADLWLDGTRHFVGTELYFVTTGDTVEALRNRPVPPEPPLPKVKPDSLMKTQHRKTTSH